MSNEYDAKELKEIALIAKDVMKKFTKVINFTPDLEKHALKIKDAAENDLLDDGIKLSIIKENLINLVRGIKENTWFMIDKNKDPVYLEKLHQKYNNVVLFFELQKLNSQEKELARIGKTINGPEYQINPEIKIGQYVTKEMTLTDFLKKSEAKPTLTDVDNEIKLIDNECSKLKQDATKNVAPSDAHKQAMANTKNPVVTNKFIQLINKFWDTLCSLFTEKKLPKQVSFVEVEGNTNKKQEMLPYKQVVSEKLEQKSTQEEQELKNKAKLEEQELEASKQETDKLFTTKKKFDWDAY